MGVQEIRQHLFGQHRHHDDDRHAAGIDLRAEAFGNGRVGAVAVEPAAKFGGRALQDAEPHSGEARPDVLGAQRVGSWLRR